MRRLLAATLVATSFVLAGPTGEAEACSCASIDPATMLEESAAAFVGTLTQRPEGLAAPDGLNGIWVFAVEEWVKGDLGPQVGVHSPLDGGACGFEMDVGEAAGIFLHNDNGRPTSGLCSVTTPEALLAADGPLSFDGSGPPVFLIAGPTGRTRLATLDRSGRLLAAAGDDRFGWSVSVCPGGDMVVDVTEGEISVRETTSLDQPRSLDAGIQGSVQQAWCLDPDAKRLLLEIAADGGGAVWLQVLGEDEPLYRGQYHTIDVSPDTVAMVAGPATGSVMVIDIATGATVRLRNAVEVGRLAFSPSGEQLLVTESMFGPSGEYATTAIVFDPSSGAVLWESAPLADTEVYGWIDEARLAGGIYPVEGDAPRGVTIGIGTGELEELAFGTGWEFFTIGDSIVWASEGKLHLMSGDGTTSELADLPSPAHTLVAVLADDDGAVAPPVTEAGPAPSPEILPTEDASFPWEVALSALAGVAGVVTVGWTAMRRRRARPISTRTGAE